ncbi:MAG TPA: hypothetical protein VGA13_02755 [Acidimicrobiales bacterium]
MSTPPTPPTSPTNRTSRRQAGRFMSISASGAGPGPGVPRGVWQHDTISRMRDGDSNAWFDLRAGEEPGLRRFGWEELRRRGVTPTSDLVEEVVSAGLLVMVDVPDTWDHHQGSLRTYLFPRLAKVVDGIVGQHASSLDVPTAEGSPRRCDLPAPSLLSHGDSGDPPTLSVLEAASVDRSGLALLAEALRLTGRSPRDLDLFVGHVTLKFEEAPAPADLLHHIDGRSRDAVRKSVQRTFERLDEVTSRDARLAPVRRLVPVAAWLAARHPTHQREGVADIALAV